MTPTATWQVYGVSLRVVKDPAGYTHFKADGTPVPMPVFVLEVLTPTGWHRYGTAQYETAVGALDALRRVGERLRHGVTLKAANQPTEVKRYG